MSGPPTESTKFDTAMVARLEKLYASPQAVAQRMRFRELLAVQRGEMGVDIGCGLGHLACELARDVSPGGHIIGLDSSPDMVNAAKDRIEKEMLTSGVEVRLGDAVALNLPNESADFVVVVQVYSYVRDVLRALQEAARVLRKGGRVAVLETDWDMCVYECKDQTLTRRILDGRWRFEHSHLPRQLHRLFCESGLTLTRCEVFPIIETQYDSSSFGASLVTIARDAAVRAGLDAVEADAWVTDIRSRSRNGEYFFSTNRFIFIATK